MAGAGAELLVDTVRWGVVGYVEAYVRLPLFAARYWRLVRLVERTRPHLLLLIDFPGMNREIARRFSGRLPILYYFPPQTYGRRGRSAARMARLRVRLLATLPFEAEAYRRAGADVVYVGHPAVDETASMREASPSLRRLWGGESGTPMVALLPGSRLQEVRTLLPPMLEALRGLPVQVVLPVASPHLRPLVEERVRDKGLAVRLVDGRSLEVMAASDAVVLASGTAAVEAACLGVPMVVVYRVSPLTAWIARTFVVTPDVGREGWSVPSIVLGRPAVPELIQEEVRPERIRSALEPLLGDVDVRTRVAADLAEVRRRLGPPGVVDRVASDVLRALDSASGRGLP